MMRPRRGDMNLDRQRRYDERREPGFTLVEVLVMSLLLAFVLLSVVTLFVFGIKHNAWGRDEMVMATLAQRKVEQLRKVSPANLFDDPWLDTALATFDATGVTSLPSSRENTNWN